MKPEALNVPITERPPLEWGSDAIAELLSRLDLPYIAMVPGSSYRGLHDSLVNYLGNTGPQMIVCLHEEHSVAIAQGYAKVTGRPMLVGLHSNVGLMHAAMAIYNAYCDRAPMVLIGATGPLDAAKRRPWIDWVHTSADQAAIVRHYVKWDDQPGSVEAALESLMRGNLLTRTEPSAPVYICLDSEIQECEVGAALEIPQPERYPVATDPAPDSGTVDEILAMLASAERPLILLGRSGRTEEEWNRRVALVEALGVCCLTDMRMPAAFPTEHPSHPAKPGAGRLSKSGVELVRQSDLILSLNWTELSGTLAAAFGDGPRPTVVTCKNLGALLNGWTKDHFALVSSDLEVTAGADQMVSALLARVGEIPPVERPDWPPVLAATRPSSRPEVEGDPILMSDLASAIREAAGSRKITYTTLPLGWSAEDALFAEPLDYLGRDGGGGVGSGPGIAVGAALALDGTGRVPVAVLGDGDYLMGSSALWTAAHYRLPLLVIVANNRSYFNDEGHQQQVAQRRSRPVENRSVGQHLRDPDPDLATIARGHGLSAYGPVLDPSELQPVLSKAFDEVRAGGTVVVDVRVNPYGYGRA
ncbi:thiamine pyrophosphate-binding protein [Nonomuraea sp. NEAU-A123]|uniref:thiamine pyrophosphate-binding protein n=1 Tax=Nonomuraea sp. NEAU-A123 TaxID=2839649 RepID=UPI001BE42859|nr:thiamine pyrophosphate-binding protein [Nonomuraea sp. NEAU-A123]MBT2228179.1 thiamine pyrophosphate-binding protein [Nonomuraea sp. NEAU-A123]